MKTEAWWVCGCGALIAKVGDNFRLAIEKHWIVTNCHKGCKIVQVDQRAK